MYTKWTEKSLKIGVLSRSLSKKKMQTLHKKRDTTFCASNIEVDLLSPGWNIIIDKMLTDQENILNIQILPENFKLIEG